MRPVTDGLKRGGKGRVWVYSLLKRWPLVCVCVCVGSGSVSGQAQENEPLRYERAQDSSSRPQPSPPFPSSSVSLSSASPPPNLLPKRNISRITDAAPPRPFGHEFPCYLFVPGGAAMLQICFLYTLVVFIGFRGFTIGHVYFISGVRGGGSNVGRVRKGACFSILWF